MTDAACIKVASFNLKRASHRGAHAWENRRELVARVIRNSGASILGVQELLPEMWEDLNSLLENYSIYGQGRMKDLSEEQSAILVRNDDLRLEGGRTFWLSKHPERSGSRAYFAVFPRICTVCRVYIREYGRTVRVFNTHFDHICGPARTLGVRIILEYMHQLNQQEPLPTILMGDLNAGPNSKPIRILSQNLHHYPDIHLTNIYSSPGGNRIRGTYHGFTGQMKFRHPLDYIFVSDHFTVRDTYLDTTSIGGAYPSDHFPLIAVLELQA